MLRMNIFLGSFAIILLTFLVYSPSLSNSFVNWDDGLLIFENLTIQGLNSGNIFTAFTSYDPELYVPLTLLSYQIDHAIWGLNPLGFHLTNLLLHIGSALMVVWLVWLLLNNVTLRSPAMSMLRDVDSQSESPPQHDITGRLEGSHSSRIFIALFAGALFAVHPLHTEAVVWAAARKDVLSGFFFLLSLNLYLLYRSSDSTIATGSQRLSNRGYGRGLFWMSVGTFILACLSKVIAVVLPVILLLIDWRNNSLSLGERDRERGWRFLFIEKIPYFLISITFIIIALYGKSGSHGLWWEKVLIGTKATVFYIQQLFWPQGFSVLYPYTRSIEFANPDLLVSFLLVCFITTLTLILSLQRERKYIKEFVFGWLFFLILLAPSFTNFAKGQDVLKDVYFASDRYAYLASVGVIYLAVFGFGFGVRKWKIPTAILTITLTLILSYISYNQSLTWNNTKSLFTNVVQHYKNSHVAFSNLAGLLREDGEVDAAIMEYRKSIDVRPNSAAFFSLGQIYKENGYPDIATEAYAQAIKMRPSDADARANLGSLYLEKGRLSEAEAVLEEGLGYQEDSVLLLFNLGLVYERQGRSEEAIVVYEKIIDIDPRDIEAVKRLEILKNMSS